MARLYIRVPDSPLFEGEQAYEADPIVVPALLALLEGLSLAGLVKRADGDMPLGAPARQESGTDSKSQAENQDS